MLKNTGTAAVTVSVASYGYFRKGLTFSELTAGPSDKQWGTSVRVNSTTPTLTAAASSVAADPVGYTFEVAALQSDTPVASAISWGGGYRQYRPDAINSVTKRWDRYRFRRKAKDNSFTWSAVVNHHKHFEGNKKRLTWRWSYADVQVGDIIYFGEPGDLFHMAVVTKKTSNSRSGIFYSHHGGAPARDKSLAKTSSRASFAKVNK
ncbi:DUF1287 domain-containing protein [Actinocorallia herbida]|uniref:DUF1287 domain-containing protein n=1 Tax=Actinocorallia herbida TaxID=58109 RepID=UPI00319D91C0